MSAETTAQQPDLIVQIDYKGIEFDPFAVDNDPVLSNFRNSRLADDGTLERMPDEWVLTRRSADGATNKTAWKSLTLTPSTKREPKRSSTCAASATHHRPQASDLSSSAANRNQQDGDGILDQQTTPSTAS